MSTKLVGAADILDIARETTDKLVIAQDRIAELEAERDQWRKRYEKRARFSIKTANESERLETINADLLEALEPFADKCEEILTAAKRLECPPERFNTALPWEDIERAGAAIAKAQGRAGK